MELERKKFQGVLNILSFNRHFYIGGLLVLAMIIPILIVLNLSTILIWLIVCAFLFGLLMPLIVSAYVYDFSDYYDFKWLRTLQLLNSKPNHITNINAGFDETSFILKHNFPHADINVFDFYNAKQHTEPAIVRARKACMTYPGTKQISTDLIPLKDKSTDIIFLLSAVHEIRSNEEKIAFLKECHRVCKPNGKVIMIEHLRDIPNFFAFTIGFTHFFSRNVWEKAFQAAGFSSFNETKFTPFMSIFYCSP